MKGRSEKETRDRYMTEAQHLRVSNRLFELGVPFTSVGHRDGMGRFNVDSLYVETFDDVVASIVD